MAELGAAFPLGHAVGADPRHDGPGDRGRREIVKTLLEAIGLVILVVFIFLQNWRATLIPMLTIPVSLVGAFMFFPAVGFSVNTLALLGLVLAVGLVVDDAIVVVEAIEAKIEQGRSPSDAALEAMDEVGGALVGIALVLSAVFIPAGFMAGITGSLYRQFALTIAFSVLLSAFNALTLSPALGALLLRPRSTAPGRGPLARFFALFNAGFARAQNGYVRTCDLLIRKVAIAILLLVGFAVLAGGLGKILPQSFLPDEDQGYFFMNVELPPAASLERTNAVMRQVDAILKNEPRYPLLQRRSPATACSRRRAAAGTEYISVNSGPTRDRSTAALQSEAIVADVNRKMAALPDAQVVCILAARYSRSRPGQRHRFLRSRSRGQNGRLPLAEYSEVPRRGEKTARAGAYEPPVRPGDSADVRRGRQGQSVQARHLYRRRLQRVANAAWRLLRRSVQPLRARVEGVRRSRAAVSRQAS